MSKHRIFLIASLIPLAILTTAFKKPVHGDDAKPSVVPFEMLISNHMVVSAKLNGKGPYRLIFDLGAPITLLSNRAGEGSGALDKNAPKSFLFAMRGEANVKELEVGDLKAKDLPVVVLDHPAISALGAILGKPLDGIIGFTFFARYKTTIDYQKQEMTFAPVDFEIKNLMKDLPNRLAGPKTARRRVLASGALLGFDIGKSMDQGVEVTEVFKGTPADEAGLETGDILTVLDGRWTTDAADTHAAAQSLKPGAKVVMTVVREGKDVDLTIVPAEGL